MRHCPFNPRKLVSLGTRTHHSTDSRPHVAMSSGVSFRLYMLCNKGRGGVGIASNGRACWEEGRS